MERYKQLKEKHRAERASYSPALSIRVHRALSWLNKAEQSEDNDSKFIFLWISFNAAYAQEINQSLPCGEKDLYGAFLTKLERIDYNNNLHNIVWSQYSSGIRLILDNKFILKAFWDFNLDKITEIEWKRQQDFAKITANSALSSGDTSKVLSIVFSRLYVLRNQMFHGGATYGSSVNREQLKNCVVVLEKIIPVIIEIMMDSKNEMWGDPVYPLITR